MLSALRSDKALPVAERNSQDSSTEEIHSAASNTTQAKMAPSSRVRRDMRALPTFQEISSNSCNTSGSTPVIHSTAAHQTSHDSERSITRTACATGKAACSTLAPTRMSDNDTSTGRISLKSASAMLVCKTARATRVNPSNSSGNSAPSNTLRPNKMESGETCRTARRSSVDSPQDRPTQTNNAAISTSTPGCSRALSERSQSCSIGADSNGASVASASLLPGRGAFFGERLRALLGGGVHHVGGHGLTGQLVGRVQA